MALGERILAELGDPHTNSTLTRWLAHHTARLISEADKAREASAPDADAQEAEARQAILQLWQARATWPAGWPPPRATEIVRLLDDLPSLDDEEGWYRDTVLGRLQDVHYHVLAVLTDLITSDGTDVEQGWLDTFGDKLTPAEALLLRRAAARPRRIESLSRWWKQMEESNDLVEAAGSGNDADEKEANPEPPAHPLLEFADTYHATIVSLLKRITSTIENTDAGAGAATD
jgi:hypothetical protein